VPISTETGEEAKSQSTWHPPGSLQDHQTRDRPLRLGDLCLGQAGRFVQAGDGETVPGQLPGIPRQRAVVVAVAAEGPGLPRLVLEVAGDLPIPLPVRSLVDDPMAEERGVEDREHEDSPGRGAAATSARRRSRSGMSMTIPSASGEPQGFESWVERDHLVALDFDPTVTAEASQPFWLLWRAGGKVRRHAPDFFATPPTTGGQPRPHSRDALTQS
jgi:hypothetical protein